MDTAKAGCAIEEETQVVAFMATDTDIYDIMIIGGGVNGCGIARDAAGRGLKVGLAEMNDLASATSGSSTKLIHGGLRYLEHMEFRLVKESLKEREVLLKAMPHIAWPLRFVLPLHPAMRFDGHTPVSRVLTRLMPWLEGRRPKWVIRLGLFLYDHFAGRSILPGTRTVNLTQDPVGQPLKDTFRKAFEYSDCWVDDARLVVLNARDAHRHGAHIMTRTKVVQASIDGGKWILTLNTNGQTKTVQARSIVNAAGPWVDDIMGTSRTKRIRLIRGSHIVTRRLFDHDKSYVFQGSDGRIIFAIPYETDFTLIGTTDVEHKDMNVAPYCTDAEQNYLLGVASQYFKLSLARGDIVWTYSGVRPLLNDETSSATQVTRDYKLEVDSDSGAPILSVLGGKLTTYRKLSETAVDKLVAILGHDAGSWTKGRALPGGDFAYDRIDQLVAELREEFTFLDNEWSLRLVRAYGTEAKTLLAGISTAEELGRDFGATVTAAELNWVIAKEWVLSAEDFLWRRSKLGLRVSVNQVMEMDSYIAQALSGAPALCQAEEN